jgi:formate hydrogenlyase subunit 3/multisubunit Na+/H+ antiporter MnhD subunit
MFFGADGEATAAAHESPRVMLVGSGILATGCVLLGVAPQLGLDYLVAPALTSMGLAGDLGVGWFGFSSAGGAFVAAGLGLAVLSLVVGGVAYRAMSHRAFVPETAAATVTWAPRELVCVGPAAAALPPVGRSGAVAGASSAFTGGEPLAAFAHPRASDFSRPVATGLAPFYAWADPDRYYLAGWHGLLRACALAGRASRWLERRAVPALVALALGVGMVAGATSGVVRSGSPAVHTGVRWPVVGAVGLALVALLLTLAASATLRRHLALAAVTGVLAVGGLLTGAELPRLLELEGAAFLAVLLLARAGVDGPATRTYLAAAVVSAAALIGGTLLLESGPAGVVEALVLTGFAVKLALVPAYVWLPSLAARTPAALLGLVVAVVDLTAVVELAALRHTAPWLFAPHWPWTALALLSALGGVVLALAQDDVKRMLAFATVSTSGLLVLGVAHAGTFGVPGALAVAAADALAMALLFSAVAAVEAAAETDPARPGPLTLTTRGAARRHPLAAAGFVAGSLTALGVPFTAGFAGHWRLYATALDAGRLVLAAFIVTTIGYVLAYARVVATVWWGGTDDEVPVPHDQPRPVPVWAGEPPPLVAALLMLVVTVIVAGLLPQVLTDWGAR